MIGYFMDKVLQTPEESLGKFFEIGQQCKFKKLTKAQIRRLYFNWLKDNSDERPFEEVFQEKLENHKIQWKKAYGIKKVDFKPLNLGRVVLTYKEGVATLTFTSIRHRPLKISKPIKSHFQLLKWIKEKIRAYSEENTVLIDIEVLKNDLEAPINTTILLF